MDRTLKIVAFSILAVYAGMALFVAYLVRQGIKDPEQ